MPEILQIPSSVQEYADKLGVFIMTAATVVGMLELSNHGVNRYILPAQTATVTVNNSQNDINSNQIRREKEETATESEFVSYSQSQRTPPRSGTR